MASRNNHCGGRKHFQNDHKAGGNNQSKAPPGFKYVPGKVLVPLPKPQQTEPVTHNTYVTNVIYNGPPGGSSQTIPSVIQKPTPIRVIPMVSKLPPQRPKPISPHGVTWELVTPESAMRLSHRAVVGGHEGWDGSPLWVIRARQGNDVVPGKLAVKHKVAYVPFAGKEMQVHNIEVLCATPGRVKWVTSSNGIQPFGAIPAGSTATGETLFVGRANYNNSITPGKVHPSHRTCYISFSGKEVSVKSYEVLCTV